MLVFYVKNAWKVNLVCELCTVAVRSIVKVCMYMEEDLYISV